LKQIKNSGFTLIELVISILIIGIIGTLSTRMLFQGAGIYFQQTDRQKLTSQSRSAIWRIQKDIRNQSNAANFNLSDSDTLVLLDLENQTKKYCARNNGKLFMITNSNSSILADSITLGKTNFSFFNSTFENITPSSGNVLNGADVRLTKIDFLFNRFSDTLALSSYVFPQNFRYGQKKSYHD
tara:strand:- start:853 stop:1401 length:549 start_codon:yes stop_codon:yes gene_type:complete